MKSVGAACCLVLLIGALPVVAGDKCFGAAGMQCGMFSSGPLGDVAFCAAWLGNPVTTFCEVSGGSWSHDTCCAANPNGHWCNGAASAANATCTAAWDKAVRRFVWGYQWVRVVDGTRVDNDGQVNRSEYCAANGSGVHKNDTEYCCSNAYRRPNFLEWVGRPSIRICRS